MDIKRKGKELDEKCDRDIPCPICGGDGEVVNPNHLLADYAIGRRYETCRLCYGLGRISSLRYEEYLHREK